MNFMIGLITYKSINKHRESKYLHTKHFSAKYFSAKHLPAKHLLALLLCVVMALTAMPAQVQAESVKMLGSYSLKIGEIGTINMSSISETSTTWKSTKPKVATVTGSGLKGDVIGHKPGKTKIIITCNTLNKKYGVYVTVTGSKKSSKKSSNKSSGKKIQLNKKALVIKKGKTGKLKLLNAKASKVKWKSKNKKIAIAWIKEHKLLGMSEARSRGALIFHEFLNKQNSFL